MKRGTAGSPAPSKPIGYQNGEPNPHAKELAGQRSPICGWEIPDLRLGPLFFPPSTPLGLPMEDPDPPLDTPVCWVSKPGCLRAKMGQRYIGGGFLQPVAHLPRAPPKATGFARLLEEKVVEVCGESEPKPGGSNAGPPPPVPPAKRAMWLWSQPFWGFRCTRFGLF